MEDLAPVEKDYKVTGSPLSKFCYDYNITPNKQTKTKKVATILPMEETSTPTLDVNDQKQGVS